MIVTDIRPYTGQKYCVELDGQFAFILYKGELSRFQVRRGEALCESAYREIMEEVLPLRAKRYAMNLLTKTDRTYQELRCKLRDARYPEQAAEQAIAYVASYGYLNDARYAEHYLDLHRDSLSRRQISRKLKEKGISEELIEEVFEKAEPADSDAIIRSLLKKRLRNQTKLTETELRRMEGFLARRGFSREEIWRGLRQWQEKTWE